MDSIQFKQQAPGSPYDAIGQIGPTYFGPKDCARSFLIYEKETLEDNLHLYNQPACLLRPSQPIKGVKWEGWEEWQVYPKKQQVRMRQGLGILEEYIPDTTVKLSHFMATQDSNTTFKEEAVFKTRNKCSTYVNSIEMDREMVTKGEAWDLFNEGTHGIGGEEVLGVNSPFGYVGTPGSMFPVHIEDNCASSIKMVSNT